MKILLIHQNFPGQFKHLGPALVAQGHTVVALTPKATKPGRWHGIHVVPYRINRESSRDIHPWLLDLESKVVRAECCFDAAVQLRDRLDFTPDIVLAHHGWGESLFLRDVWPGARIGLYCEFFHQADFPYLNFDPEFPTPSPGKDRLRLRIKNINNRMHFDIGDAGISPTRFQANTFPPEFQGRIDIIHDGIDTDDLVPDPRVTLALDDNLTLTRNDEVITFVNRNLEPYRGYHVFMRALPKLLQRRPRAHVLIVGGDGTSYGAKPPDGQTWKRIFIEEVRDAIPDADWQRVHFVGRIPYDRFRRLLQLTRLHVYLTYPFVLSWSLLEAMSVQAPILASDTAPVREVMEDDETGWLVGFHDREGLVDKACHLLDDAATRNRIGAAARVHVRANFDLKTVCLPRQLEWVNRLSRCTPRDVPV